MRIGIIGANGRLGQALLRAFAGHDAIAWTRTDFDVRDHERTAEAILAARPDIVVNTAAFHNTEACEDDPGQAFAVNAIAVRNIARVCQQSDSLLVHISTDYVFDGRKRQPYDEQDRPNPRNVYGVSKLAGEQFVTAICDRYYLPRVASLFGVGHSQIKRGFVEMVLGKAERGERLVVVDDVVMSPTYTVDAAQAIRRLVEVRAPHGVYHLTNSGACSWYAFAIAVLRVAGLTAEITPTTAAAWPSKAVRPPFSALASRALVAAGLEPLRPWEAALRAYLSDRVMKVSA